jgi:hypothetical protein
MTEQNKLSDRLRAGSECAPWVIEEVKQLEAVLTEQNKQPDLAEHLRQFKHNDGSGLVFGYDKDGIDKLFASLNKQPPAEAGEGVVAWLATSDDGESHLGFDRQDLYRDVLRIYTMQPLYASQTTATQAAVAAAMRRCAEILEDRANEWDKITTGTHAASYAGELRFMRRAILAAITKPMPKAMQEDS